MLTEQRSIEIGFSNNIFDNPADVVDSVSTISTEFSAIEIEIAEEAEQTIFHSSPFAYAELTSQLRDLAATRELQYSVHAAWFGRFTDMLHPDEQERAKSANYLLRALRFAVDIQANILVFHPGNTHDRNTDVLVAALCDNLIPIINACQNAGVALCLENMGDQRPAHAVFTATELIAICEKSGIHLCLDVPHLASVSKTAPQLLEDARQLAPYVRHIHLGDTNMPDHRHMPLGMGDIPIDDVLTELEREGVTAHAIVEEFNRPFEAAQYWDAAVAFRAGFVGKEGTK